MTDKEVLNTIKKEFKGKSYDTDTDGCFYRMGERKCIAGCFIPDELYTIEFENKSVDVLVLDNSLPEDIFPLDRLKMQQWQLFHDNKIDQDDDIEVQQDQLFNEYKRLNELIDNPY